MRFVMLNDNLFVREDQIVRLEYNGDVKDPKWTVYLVGEEKHEVTKDYMEEILGISHIVQIVPVPEETWCVYHDTLTEDGKFIKDKVDAYAVMADGSLRPINYGLYFSAGIFLDDQYFDILVPNHEVWDVDRKAELAKYYSSHTDNAPKEENENDKS